MRKAAGKIWLGLLGLLLPLLLAACHPATVETGGGLAGLGRSYGEVVAGLCAGRVGPGEKLGVGGFYDGTRGDYTALGDHWRDRAETALVKNGFRVAAVRDMGPVLDLLEQRRPDFDESAAWHESAGRYLLIGRYYLYPGRDEKAGDAIEIELKLLDSATLAVVGAASWRARLAPGWQREESVVRGNVYQQAVAAIGPERRRRPGPQLKAELDRRPPCYPAGSALRIRVATTPGVHLYILNLAADNTVTLVLPNRYLPDRPQPAADFTFPPDDLPHLKLLLYPLAGESTSREAFKVIASFKPLDFSFLKVPEGRIFAGAEAAELRRVLAVLKQAEGWSEVTLPYRVGRGCE